MVVRVTALHITLIDNTTSMRRPFDWFRNISVYLPLISGEYAKLSNVGTYL